MEDNRVNIYEIIKKMKLIAVMTIFVLCFLLVFTVIYLKIPINKEEKVRDRNEFNIGEEQIKYDKKLAERNNIVYKAVNGRIRPAGETLYQQESDEIDRPVQQQQQMPVLGLFEIFQFQIAVIDDVHSFVLLRGKRSPDAFRRRFGVFLKQRGLSAEIQTDTVRLLDLYLKCVL